MKPEKQKFPRSFWTANATELFERGAYYAMASFVVIYLGRLGFGEYWPSTLNGVLWTIVYFLPILSGTIADQIGFRKALLLAFVLIFGGYLFMSYPVLIAGHELAPKPLPGFGASVDTVIAVVAGILLIGVGGSFVKPCISGTIQKTSLGRATLGFAIFYMIINIGSLFGRAASFTVRTKFNNISLIFVVAAACAAIAFLIVMFLYRDPRPSWEERSRPNRRDRSARFYSTWSAFWVTNGSFCSCWFPAVSTSCTRRYTTCFRFTWRGWSRTNRPSISTRWRTRSSSCCSSS